MRKKFVIIFIIVILVGAGIAFWQWQKGSFSKEVLKLEILGTENCSLAQEVNYIVKFKNNGRVRLENPELCFTYPENSILRERQPLIKTLSSADLGGDIYPGEERSFTFETRLLGKEGDAKIAKATLSYRPKDLKTRYELSTTFITIIKKVPLNFTFDLLSNIEAGRELSFRINYFSNVDYPLTGLRCELQYPSDFEFLGSQPKALDQKDWDLPLLNQAGGGRIEIHGILRGEAGEQKFFSARLGLWQDGEFILLQKIIKGVEIIEPSLYISQQINGNPQYVASPGELLHYEIFFRNIGKDPLTNLVLISRLTGKGLDFYSLKAPKGNFGTGDNSIIWEGRRIPKLQFLEAGEEGEVEFWIELKKEWLPASLGDKNPEVRNKIILSQVEEEFSNKVSSILKIEQKADFEDILFDNSGPFPLSADKKTTFTLSWNLKNYFNKLQNVKVRAILPQGVDFTGKIFPEEDSGLTFDPQSREVVWQAGDLEPGVGILSAEKDCSFQLSIKPEQSQKGKEMSLISSAYASGDDQWTGLTIKSSASPIKTVPN